MITITQIKAARTLLDWTQRDLAKQAGLSLASIANLEQGVGKVGGKVFTAVCNVLQQAGIEFTRNPACAYFARNTNSAYWKANMPCWNYGMTSSLP